MLQTVFVSGTTWECDQSEGGKQQKFERRNSKQKKEVIDMPLLQVVIVLIVVGVLLWLVNRFIPMQSTIKSILNAVVVIAVVIWLLNLFGLFQAFSNIHVGK
jgi:cation transporter-like permease